MTAKNRHRNAHAAPGGGYVNFVARYVDFVLGAFLNTKDTETGAQRTLKIRLQDLLIIFLVSYELAFRRRMQYLQWFVRFC